ncbi:hypothetical protein Hanom_Chr02g00161791 [Helianthus anomalus]
MDSVSLGGAVFVSDLATFIVNDNLCVMPYTSANSVRLLTDYGITNTSSLEDIKFDVDCEQDQTKSSTSKIHLEVSLQKSTGKFLFAEAENDFVEFVFGFLSIPLGTIIGTLLNGASSFRCMDNFFKSISKMSVAVGNYLKSQHIKDLLLLPHIGQPYSSTYNGNILYSKIQGQMRSS